MKIDKRLKTAGFLVLLALAATPAKAEDIIETIGGINTLLYGIAAGIAALMITFHAIKWKTAAGPNDREEAKRGIINVILGLILIMIAASLVGLLFRSGGGISPPPGTTTPGGGTTPPAGCNNNKNCEPWTGENNANCPNDCCPDGSSTSANPGCINPPASCNKNGVCETPGENSINCPSDCCPDSTSRNTNPTCNKPPSGCNNNKNCDVGENNANCPNDCCPDGSSKSVNPTCGGATPTTTTTSTTSTTTTVECLTAKNLAAWINNKGGKFWHGDGCPWCIAQQNVWKMETAPVGPGDAALKTIPEKYNVNPSPCGGIPCWTEGTADTPRGSCQSLPGLCSKYGCPYPNCAGHTYLTCDDVYS
jgi:hypothetical protein